MLKKGGEGGERRIGGSRGWGETQRVIPMNVPK